MDLKNYTIIFPCQIGVHCLKSADRIKCCTWIYQILFIFEAIEIQITHRLYNSHQIYRFIFLPNPRRDDFGGVKEQSDMLY